MVIYMYLFILIVVSIITGIIVTIMERKGFYPLPSKRRAKDEKTQVVQPVVEQAPAVIPQEQEPVYYEQPVYTEAVYQQAYTQPEYVQPQYVEPVYQQQYAEPLYQEQVYIDPSYVEPVSIDQVAPVEFLETYPAPKTDPVIVDAVTMINMQPVKADTVEVEDNYDVPVMISSYTVDLSDVVNNIKEIEVKDNNTIQNTNMTEGLV